MSDRVKTSVDQERFLRAENFTKDGHYQAFTLTIAKVIPGGEIIYENGMPADMALAFEKTDKVYVLNRTNYRLIKQMHGSNAASWVGRKITLTPAAVRFGSETCLGLRVRIPDGMTVSKGVSKHYGRDLDGHPVNPGMATGSAAASRQDGDIDF